MKVSSRLRPLHALNEYWLPAVNEQRELRVLLESFKHLFDGTLGDFDTAPVSIELLTGAIPYHARPYPVPVIHKETVRKEIQRLFDLGVLEKCNDSAHAAPTFIIAKKTGTVRVVSDFRRLNAKISNENRFLSPIYRIFYRKLEDLPTLRRWT